LPAIPYNRRREKKRMRREMLKDKIECKPKVVSVEIGE